MGGINIKLMQGVDDAENQLQKEKQTQKAGEQEKVENKLQNTHKATGNPQKTEKQSMPKITPKPEMSVSATTYPKLHKIYKELIRQNETIFGAEKERDALEEKQGNLKGLSKLTKKGELQSEIDQINERINLLKVGLSGIAKRYGYQTVQDFYRAYYTAKNAYADYQDKAAKWEETYGTKPKGDTLHNRIQSYQRDESARQPERTTHRKDREAR